MGKIDNDMFLFIIVLFLSIDVLFSSEDSTVWKTVPSVARVTRDEVSGLKPHDERLSGRQYLSNIKPPSCPPCGKKGKALAIWGSS